MTEVVRKRFKELAERAGHSVAPALVSKLPMRPGGVDPLGLRQVNFDLMDRVLPGLNNAATRLRPYVLVTWAWWKAVKLGRERGGLVHQDLLKGFVDRVEVLFVASHIEAGEMDGLLGARVLNRYRGSGNEFELAGPKWEALRRNRRNTSLMAPVAYGPSIKVGAGLGFLRTDDEGLMVPMAEVIPAVEAFDAALAPIGQHPALATLECPSISASELADFHPHWRTADLTDAERAVGRRRLFTDPIAASRRPMIELILEQLAAVQRSLEVGELRTLLARTLPEQAPSTDAPPHARTICRVLQTQQLFRYGLEALLVWVLRSIGARPAGLAELRDKLLGEMRGNYGQPFGTWLLKDPFVGLDFDPVADPASLINLIEGRSWDEPWPGDALDAVRVAMRISEREANGSALFGGQADRLPLAQALKRVRLLAGLSSEEALEILISEWLIGQHIYWAVGRSGDETQRLRLILEEGGWTAALPDPSFPEPTPDRLATVLSLMADVGLALRHSDGRFSGVA